VYLYRILNYPESDYIGIVLSQSYMYVNGIIPSGLRNRRVIPKLEFCLMQSKLRLITLLLHNAGVMGALERSVNASH
jgi:hypothetical protein